MSVAEVVLFRARVHEPQQGLLVLLALDRYLILELILAGPTTWLLGDGKDSHQRKLEELKVEAERLSKEDF
jgi:hypothetical protein